MSMNRAMRRQQAKDQMKEWIRTGTMERVRQIQKNGITTKDLEDNYAKGHEDGFKAGADKTLKTVYAGVVLCLLDAGNTQEEAISFLRELDDRLITSIDEGEDIEEVFKRTGVMLMLKDDFNRVREVAE